MKVLYFESNLWELEQLKKKMFSKFILIRERQHVLKLSVSGNLDNNWYLLWLRNWIFVCFSFSVFVRAISKDIYGSVK